MRELSERDYRWVALKPGCKQCDKIIAWRKAHPHEAIRCPDMLLINIKRLKFHPHINPQPKKESKHEDRND
jgi:hypothetical protein